MSSQESATVSGSCSSDANFATLNSSNKSIAQPVKTYFASTLGPSVLSSSSNSLCNQASNQSAIFINVKEINLQLFNEIIVSWNILEDTSPLDFIGIYKLLSSDDSDFIERKQLNSSKIGQIIWSLDKLKQTFSENLNDSVEFRYYSGLRAQHILARSEPLRVEWKSNCSMNKNQTRATTKSYELITFKISDLKASQLRKGMFFNPDPYVKMSILPNQSLLNGLAMPTNTSSKPKTNMPRYYKTNAATNTCFPNWKHESFEMVARENDRILFEVKDKFIRTKPSINRFLGRVLVDISRIVDKVKQAKG